MSIESINLDEQEYNKATLGMLDLLYEDYFDNTIVGEEIDRNNEDKNSEQSILSLDSLQQIVDVLQISQEDNEFYQDILPQSEAFLDNLESGNLLFLGSEIGQVFEYAEFLTEKNVLPRYQDFSDRLLLLSNVLYKMKDTPINPKILDQLSNTKFFYLMGIVKHMHTFEEEDPNMINKNHTLYLKEYVFDNINKIRNENKDPHLEEYENVFRVAKWTYILGLVGVSGTQNRIASGYLNHKQTNKSLKRIAQYTMCMLHKKFGDIQVHRQAS